MILNSREILVPYIERKNTKRFEKLTPDEQLIAHWALSIKELIKYDLEALLEGDLDTIETVRQFNLTSNDGFGGIDYYNYMYSKNYKDDEGLKKDKIEIGGQDPDYWAKLSVYKALERFCVTAGDWPGVVCLLGKWYEKIR